MRRDDLDPARGLVWVVLVAVIVGLLFCLTGCTTESRAKGGAWFCVVCGGAQVEADARTEKKGAEAPEATLPASPPVVVPSRP